jgi:hypothetical protein
MNSKDIFTYSVEQMKAKVDFPERFSGEHSRDTHIA